jgi:hypothetical protein
MALHQPGAVMAAMRRARLRRGTSKTKLSSGRQMQFRRDTMGLVSNFRNAIQRRRNFNPENAYLEESTSLIDLEARQREIDRGRFRQRKWPY